MTSSTPAYAVPGVQPAGGSSDLTSVEYAVEQLAAQPLVAAHRAYARHREIDLPY
ncbi:hypothetical protein [Catellatospora sichuanensis]|uniref:hypothetical protein n=1 Tax=Catellatospora sichuanensis TaxID=1969805 RepID=UPI001642B781|nr:hypothetical protein [Catellatospora sichuanensis]